MRKEGRKGGRKEGGRRKERMKKTRKEKRKKELGNVGRNAENRKERGWEGRGL